MPSRRAPRARQPRRRAREQPRDPDRRRARGADRGPEQPPGRPPGRAPHREPGPRRLGVGPARTTPQRRPRLAARRRRARPHLGCLLRPRTGLPLEPQPRQPQPPDGRCRHYRDRRGARAPARRDRPVHRLAVLGAGALVGLLYGTLFNRFGVPSFVITLAGLLALFGLQLRVLGNQGTINLPFESSLVRFASQQFLPVWLAYLLAVLAPAVYALSAWRRNARRAEAGLSTTPLSRLALRALGLAAILIIVVAVLNRDRGVSYMFLAFLVLVVIMDLAIRRTTWGRSVLAIGGNVEAARRAGINVKRIYLSVFTLCSTFAALGGIFAASRLASANQSSGGGDTNLNAIAAAVIGGTSLFGGRGSGYSG